LQKEEKKATVLHEIKNYVATFVKASQRKNFA